MKNVTIVLDEAVARWLRIQAAENETSVSRYAGQLLGDAMERSRGYDTAQDEFFSVEPRNLRKSGESVPRRDELYDR